MKSEKEIIHEYATELKMPVFKDELEYILSRLPLKTGITCAS